MVFDTPIHTGLPSSSSHNDATSASSQPMPSVLHCSPKATLSSPTEIKPMLLVSSGTTQTTQASVRPTEPIEPTAPSGPHSSKSALAGHSVHGKRTARRASRTISAAASVAVAQRRIERDGGLTPECSAKYIDLLRGFLNAKICKTEFENAIADILKTRTARRIHNAIIIGFLRASMMRRRPQLPQLPAVLPGSLKSKIQMPACKPSSLKHPTNLPVSNSPTSELPASKLPVSKVASPKLPAPNFLASELPRSKAPAEASEVCPSKYPRVDTSKAFVPIPEALSDTHCTAHTPTLDSVSATGGSSKPKKYLSQSAPSTFPQISAAPPSTLHDSTPLTKERQSELHVEPCAQVDVAQESIRSNYHPYFIGLSPAPDGLVSAMDADLFIRLRQRVHQLTTHSFGMMAPHDDAVVLLFHSIEIHVKMLLQATVNIRLHRVSVPSGLRFVSYPPISSRDVLQVARQNMKLIGDEVGVEHERLLLMP